jgi:multicomponent K+:H+ antiporter subunit D
MSALANVLAPHAIILPIVVPLVAGALLVLLEKSKVAACRRSARWLSFAATALQALLAAALLLQAGEGKVLTYLLGNWQAPWGIALALDRLSALMLMLTALVAGAAVVYAMGGDDQRGPHFHALFQFQLMGLNGAFLTADLFNLFVFFEVLLAASYGLLLHGATRARLQSSVHYVVFNLCGSALFLIAVSLLYAVTGTLNMADLAVKLAQLKPQDAPLAQAAALLLMVVFAVKAALLPLYFWLPDTYASASPPVAALFAIMTKVGVYAIARCTTLIFASGALAGVATPFMPWLALATLLLAAIGVLAATRLRGLVAYLVVGSAGTLLLAISLNSVATLAAALFYLVNSTLVAAALFLLVDRIAAARGGSDLLQPRALASGWVPLGAAFFMAAVAVAGVPPLAGFLGKALILQAAGATPLAVWVVALILGSSLAVMVALARAGSTVFWKPASQLSATASAAGPAVADNPHHPAHTLSIAALMLALVAAAAAAGPISAYTRAAALQLVQRQDYVDAVLGARAVLPAYDVRKEMRERGDAK